MRGGVFEVFPDGLPDFVGSGSTQAFRTGSFNRIGPEHWWLVVVVVVVVVVVLLLVVVVVVSAWWGVGHTIAVTLYVNCCKMPLFNSDGLLNV